MEDFKTFLESSTIHGLAHISTNRRLVRLLWICIVLVGFTTSAVIIYHSFQAWEESPVTTTIETLPITEITLPKVTVCPPKNTFTNLNYDLMMLENMNKTLDIDTRNELTQFALSNVPSINTNMYVDSDRYYNWYHGYTRMDSPYLVPYLDFSGGFKHNVETTATSGTISTRKFGDNFDVDEVERQTKIEIKIYPPESFQKNANAKLHFEIQKISMTDLIGGGYDNFYINSNFDALSVDGMNVRQNFTYSSFLNGFPYQGYYYVLLERKVTVQDIMNQKLLHMPGFKFSWYYTGIEMLPEAKYSNETDTIEFVRYSQ